MTTLVQPPASSINPPLVVNSSSDAPLPIPVPIVAGNMAIAQNITTPVSITPIPISET